MIPLLVFLSLAGTALGLPNCDAEPLQLPLQDVQVLSDKKDSFMRGIPAQIGRPVQNIVLLPWAELNNTWIYDSEAYCDKTIIWNDNICRVRRGNLLKEEESTTYIKANNIGAAGGAPTETYWDGSELGLKSLASSGLGGTDNFQVNGTQVLTGFPFGIPRLSWDHGYTMLHPLGLGSNSTYLNALRDAGQLSSRIWSLFWGRMWVDEPVDGSLVLGGYDENKVIGQNYTAPLNFGDFKGSSGCWTGMKVTISDIKLNFRDGRDKSLFPPNTALSCCLVPQRQLLLEAPFSYLETFENITQTSPFDSPSYGLHWSAQLFDAKTAFDGDITFSLSSGLEIRVPNSQYMPPFVDIERNGSRIFKNETRELLINGVDNQPATLGRYFFTSAYLMVDHDAGTFTLWKANPSKTSKLVKVTDLKTSTQCTNNPAATEQPTEEAAAQPRASGAVIGGSVAGGVVGLALIVLAVFFFLRHKQRSNNVEDASRAESLGHSPGGYKSPVYAQAAKDNWQRGSYHVPQELPGSNPVPFEFEGSTQSVYEMGDGQRK
ncbi:unnamed protein product [Clonostachys rosea]|uniref:Peptidase A1 domain-containing protein n=1 Tax=Bionectria ochroleuca TaxID=29856 RepID=A0ABY6URP5_BIOOC|nr:unnamed protein product [Clonostachys rosea]